MGIPTKNIKTDEGQTTGLKPILGPGNHTISILSIELFKDKNSEKWGDKLRLKVTTPPIEGFKGVAIDKTKPELGNHTGQIGFLNYSKWGFKDDIIPTGIEIFKQDELLKAIKNICDELKLTWLDEADEKYNTMEELIVAFNTEAPFRGINFHACIYGKAFLNGTYLNYDLYLPRFDRLLGKPFNMNPEKVIKFFESAGIEPLKAKTDATNEEIIREISVSKKPVENETNAAFLEAINAPVDHTYHTDMQSNSNQPVYPKVTSAAEAAFMGEGKSQINTEKISSTPFTDEIEKDIESNTGIIENNEKLPWED